MPRKTKGEASHIVRELLHGGKPVPQGLMRRHVADLKRKLETRFKEKSALQQEAQKYFAQLQNSSSAPAPDSPEAKRALNGLLQITKRLASRKLARPLGVAQIGGILAGHYTLNVVPPYDYSDSWTSVGFGNPTLSASADKSSGEMTCSVASNYTAKSGGEAFSALGIYFHPAFQSGTLRASISPSFLFSW